MSSYWRSGNSSNQKDDASLNDVLPTSALRVDLILLVALCTDSMRDCLQNAFDKTQQKPLPQQAGDHPFWQSDQDQKQAKVNRADVEWLRERDLSSSRMQELKMTGLACFNQWRTNVLRRMGESLKVKSDSVKRAKAEHVSFVAAAAKSKRDKEYFDWADGVEIRDPDQSSLAKSSTSTLPFAQIRVPESLVKLDDKKRALVLGSVLFMLLSLENYSAYSRVLLQYLCTCLALPHDVLSSAEATTAVTLLQSVNSSDVQTEAITRKQAAENADARRWKVGLATVAGALAIGVTGGLAAPLLLGAAGAIMGGVGLGGLAGLLGATIANPVTVAALFGVLGGTMSGKAMEKYAQEVEDFKFVSVHEIDPKGQQASSQKLRVIIGISGWVIDERDVTDPWRVISPSAVDTFGLRYELAALMDLGNTLDGFLRDSAYTVAQAGAMSLILPVLSAALMPVSLLKMGKFLDNPFTIAMERSDKAGRVLAHALIAKAQGERPVTLVGFSLGARVIFSCLQELSAQKAFGLVENAVLIGSPVPNHEMAWRRMRAVVVGRLVNVYTTNDMLLGYLYRARNIQVGVAGLQAINTIHGVENKDVTSIITGHNQYRLAIGKILQEINWADLDAEQIGKEEEELLAEKVREKKIHDDAKRKGLLRGQEDEDGKVLMVDAQEVDLKQYERFSGAPEISTYAKPPKSMQTRTVHSAMDDLAGLSIVSEAGLEPSKASSGIGPYNEIPKLQSPQDKDRPTTDNHQTRPFPGNSPLEDEDDDNDDDDDDGEEDQSGPIKMLDLDPEPLLDDHDLVIAQPSVTENVRFGSPDRGFNITWHGGK